MKKLFYLGLVATILSNGPLMASSVDENTNPGPAKTSKLTDFSKLQSQIDGAGLGKTEKRRAVGLLNRIAETEITLQRVHSAPNTGENSRESMLLQKKLDSYRAQLDKMTAPKAVSKD